MHTDERGLVCCWCGRALVRSESPFGRTDAFVCPKREVGDRDHDAHIFEQRDCANASPHEAHSWEWDGGAMWCSGRRVAWSSR